MTSMVKAPVSTTGHQAAYTYCGVKIKYYLSISVYMIFVKNREFYSLS
ncbi:hypothetical protein AAZX31_01G182700 [Glycine max]